MFLKAEPVTIHFMAHLYIKGKMSYELIYPEGVPPQLPDANFGMYLGMLQSSLFAGIKTYYDEKASKHWIEITDMGREFIDFISNASITKIKEMAGILDQ